MDLIHYGAEKFDRSRIQPIRDERLFVKPRGGFWASPVDSDFGWKDWCKGEGLGRLKLSFRVTFTGRLLTIDSVHDLRKLPWPKNSILRWVRYPVFEPLLAKGVDAIHLTARGAHATHLSFPRSLYGWDCESVLVMNPACLEPVETNGKNN